MTECVPAGLNISQQDVLMPVVPMFHVNAWGLPFTNVMVGAKLVLPGPAVKCTIDDQEERFTMSISPANPITIVGSITPTVQQVLTPEALAVVAALHRHFNPIRERLLQHRVER